MSFFTTSSICYGQINETNKLLYKASYLQGDNQVRNKEVQDIYNRLIAKEPTNAIFYAESGFFNLTYANKELGLVDLSVAAYLLENKLCACDYSLAYNQTKNEFHCSLELLDEIYDTKRRFFYDKKQYDSSLYYINKLIRLYTDSTGIKIDYSKFKNKKNANSKLIFHYDDKIRVSGELHAYQEALLSYHKKIAIDSAEKNNDMLIDLYAVMGEYDSAIQVMKHEVLIKTDTGIQFIYEYPRFAPEFFYTYLSAHIAKRDFNSAYKLLLDNTTEKSIPNTKGKKQKVLLKFFPMYQEGESENICDRINKGEFEYSFFNFYTCILTDLTNKNYDNALLHLNNFYKIMESKFSKLSETNIPYFSHKSYRFDYTIFSLKGYILSKLNKKEEAKKAYQQAIQLNPACKEAIEELKKIG